MTSIGRKERTTQRRVVAPFQKRLGDWTDRTAKSARLRLRYETSELWAEFALNPASTDPVTDPLTDLVGPESRPEYGQCAARVRLESRPESEFGSLPAARVVLALEHTELRRARLKFLLSPGYLDALSPSESEGIYSVKGSVKTSVSNSGTTLTTTQDTTQKVLNTGHIHFIGPDNGGHWEIIK